MADGSPFTTPSLAPPLKWAGGKRWFTQRYGRWLQHGHRRLLEPFAGSAAVFFHLRPTKAHLSDANEDLITFYKVLKEDHVALEAAFATLSTNHSSHQYYKIRDESHDDPVSSAARFLYLNRTCWNGLYRVNRLGKFNVPKGSKVRADLPTDDFAGWAAQLQGATLSSADFETLVDTAGADDFIFADPPYSTSSQPTTFAKYNKDVFTWADQQRLAKALIRAHHRGVRFMLTNANTPELRALYDGVGSIASIDCPSVISGMNKGRGVRAELAWANFDLSSANQ